MNPPNTTSAEAAPDKMIINFFGVILSSDESISRDDMIPVDSTNGKKSDSFVNRIVNSL
jgi:hypothetical protein